LKFNKLKQPVLKDDTFLADVKSRQSQQTSFHLWWLGQSGFLIQWNGRHLLIDPYLSDSLTKKYEQTDKPHVRMTAKVIDPERLNFIDVVTSSHNHTDHFDGETLIPLIEANPNIRMIIPEANRDFVCNRIGKPTGFPIGLNDGETIEVAGFVITGIPAAHNELERDENGKCKYMGFLFQMGPWTVYHSGDTLWHPAVLEALTSFKKIDVALLPINGNKPERRVPGNLGSSEAVKLGKSIRAGVVVPCHYDMFEFNTADPKAFVKEAEQANQAYEVLENGEHFSPEQS
jgi:L-ascorbate metabolism protein UlaG (beta-lactamase superfamily)